MDVVDETVVTRGALYSFKDLVLLTSSWTSCPHEEEEDEEEDFCISTKSKKKKPLDDDKRTKQNKTKSAARQRKTRGDHAEEEEEEEEEEELLLQKWMCDRKVQNVFGGRAFRERVFGGRRSPAWVVRARRLRRDEAPYPSGTKRWTNSETIIKRKGKR